MHSTNRYAIGVVEGVPADRVDGAPTYDPTAVTTTRHARCSSAAFAASPRSALLRAPVMWPAP